MERLTRTAPFGVCFWDVAARTSLVDGLLVEVFPRANPDARRIAKANPSAVYVAHDLPGLADFARSNAEPDELWATPASAYRVEVRDPYGRFLPIAFDAALPMRGLFTWLAPWFSPPVPIALATDEGSPPRPTIPHVPLFSAPSRAATDAAVVYAQLQEEATGAPGAWYLLETRVDGDPRGLGMADAEGRVAVMFPYPEPPRRLISPPVMREDFSWELELVAYGATTSPPTPAPAIADLAQVLAALDSRRDVIVPIDSPAAPLRLAYRQPLTVRSGGAAGGDASVLLVAS